MTIHVHLYKCHFTADIWPFPLQSPDDFVVRGRDGRVNGKTQVASIIICGGCSGGLCARDDSDGNPKSGTVVEISQENDPDEDDENDDCDDDDFEDEDEDEDDWDDEEEDDDVSPETDRTRKPRRGFLGLLKRSSSSFPVDPARNTPVHEVNRGRSGNDQISAVKGQTAPCAS